MVGAISMLQLNSSQFFDTRQRQLCIMCPVALDFEHHRLLDWIAYHHLLGADCFVFLLDAGMMGLAEEVQRLRRAGSTSPCDTGPRTRTGTRPQYATWAARAASTFKWLCLLTEAR